MRVAYRRRAFRKTRVANELVVAQPHRVCLAGLRRARREHRDGRTDFPAVVSKGDVGFEAGGDLGSGADVPRIEDVQRAPQVPADATVAVAPRQAGAEGQFLGGVRVGAGCGNFRADGSDAAFPCGVGQLGHGMQEGSGGFRQFHDIQKDFPKFMRMFR